MKLKKAIVIILVCMSVGMLFGGCSSGSSSSYSSSKKSSGCAYKYHDGSICGAPVGSNGTFCSKHKKELDDTYNSIMGK